MLQISIKQHTLIIHSLFIHKYLLNMNYMSSIFVVAELLQTNFSESITFSAPVSGLERKQ